MKKMRKRVIEGGASAKAIYKYRQKVKRWRSGLSGDLGKETESESKK